MEHEKHILELALRISTSYYFKKAKVNSALNSLNQKRISQEKFNRIYDGNEIEMFTENDDISNEVLGELKRVLCDLDLDDFELSIMLSRNIDSVKRGK